MSSTPLLWRPMSVSRDLSEMMLMQERAKAASLRDAEWQAQLASSRRAVEHPPPAAPASKHVMMMTATRNNNNMPPPHDIDNKKDENGLRVADDFDTNSTTTREPLSSSVGDEGIVVVAAAKPASTEHAETLRPEQELGPEPPPFHQVFDGDEEDGEEEEEEREREQDEEAVPEYQQQQQQQQLAPSQIEHATTLPPLLHALDNSDPEDDDETPSAHSTPTHRRHHNHQEQFGGMGSSGPSESGGGCGDNAGCQTDDQQDVHHPQQLETELSCDSGASGGRSVSRRRASSSRNRTDGIRKIRRRRLTKEEEARFAPDQLKDLKGTTAAKSRKMTASERDVMLHKRRLRNRESAARSRDKQRKTINEVSDDIDALSALATALQHRAASAEAQSASNKDKLDKLASKYGDLIADNERLRKELQRLSSNTSLTVQPVPPYLRRNSSSALHLSFSSDMLDKVFAGNQIGVYPTGGAVVSEVAPQVTSISPLTGQDCQSPARATGLLRIPSSMQINFSSEKLDTLVLQSLPRTYSFVDRLLGDPTVGAFTNPVFPSQGYTQLGSSSAKPPLSSFSAI